MGSAPFGSDDEVSLVVLVNALLRHRLIFIRTLLVVVGISFVVAITRPTRYTSMGTFLPESSEPSPTGALALAQQFGVSLGGGSSERSPAFYAELVRSREILRETVVRRHPGGERAEVNLIEYYGIAEDVEARRIERAVEELDDDLSVGTDLVTGIVSFSISTSDPLLSYGVAAHILELVNDFDLNTRQSQAGAERLFAGQQLDQQTGELRQVEDSLKNFLVENRSFSNSPFLLFEHDRLQRAVAMRQELVTSLAQSFQQARIDEVRNIPVITLLESPRVPALSDPKRRVLTIILGIMSGVAFGAIAVFLRNYVERPGETHTSDLEELSSLWSETMSDLRSFVTRPFRGSPG
jgi:uncharacterized protein involved in exopolysaccharide biosynthesis